MIKDDLIKEINELKKENVSLKSNNNFLLSQQKELKKYAETEVNKLMPYLHKYIRMEEQNKKLLTEISMMKKVKKSEK